MSGGSRPLLTFASLLALRAESTQAPATGYTTNAICRQRNCINPVFPGFSDLGLLEASTWACQEQGTAKPYLTFCAAAIQHEPALISPTASGGDKNMKDLINSQENAAATAYFYHLAGMNLDPWDYQKPWTSDNPCINAIWKMACMTYLPKQQAGCEAGQATPYLRMCGDVCQSYVDQCQVECCDESAKCVFQRVVDTASGPGLIQGYQDAIGPNAMCTGWAGAAARSSSVQSAALVLMLLLVVVQQLL